MPQSQSRFPPAEGPRIPLPRAAERLNMTGPGLLKLLRRTGRAIRDDGRWFVRERDLDQIEHARETLFGRPQCPPRRAPAKASDVR